MKRLNRWMFPTTFALNESMRSASSRSGDLDLYLGVREAETFLRGGGVRYPAKSLHLLVGPKGRPVCEVGGIGKNVVKLPTRSLFNVGNRVLYDMRLVSGADGVYGTQGPARYAHTHVYKECEGLTLRES